MYSEESSNADFPVSIDLGKPMNSDGPGLAPKPAKTDRNKKYYPTLYISDVAGLDDLEKEGCALIKYKLGSITKRTDKDGKETVSADLDILSLCLPDTDGDNEEEDEGMGGIVDSLAKKAGIKKDDAPAAESDDDEA